MRTRETVSARRRARERQQVRARILDVARELFATEGYDAVTMRRVAQEIEYTPPVIYQHFADKAALVREICVEDFRALAESFQDLARVADPVERLARLGARYVEFALTHPHHYRLMFMTPPPSDGSLPDKRTILDPEAHGNPMLDGYAFLGAAVHEAFTRGRFNPSVTDPELVAQALWSMVHGVAALRIARGDDAWVDWRDAHETTRLACEAMLRGLTCDAPSTARDSR